VVATDQPASTNWPAANDRPERVALMVRIKTEGRVLTLVPAWSYRSDGARGTGFNPVRPEYARKGVGWQLILLPVGNIRLVAARPAPSQIPRAVGDPLGIGESRSPGDFLDCRQYLRGLTVRCGGQIEKRLDRRRGQSVE
jgi:hypothetical protein